MIYECRSCTALFRNPSSGTCPACESDGPTCYNTMDDGTSYSNNWYAPIRDLEALVQ